MSIHFGNASGTVVADYSRRLLTRKIFGLYAEVPVAIVPPLDLNYDQNQIPKDFRALFVTPSVRLNIFSSDSVTPWVSAGGGYGRFSQSSTLVFGGPTPGPPAQIPTCFRSGRDWMYGFGIGGVCGSKPAISTLERPT
jgi:hypothetical protein